MKNILKKFISSPDFNQTFKLLVIVMIAISVFSLLAVNFVKPQYILALDLIALVMVFLIRYLKIGFYIMAFLYPFVGWEFDWGTINVPYIDLLAMFVFLAFIINQLINWENKKQRIGKKDFPALIFALLFFGASALALLNNEFLMPALKYWLRPIVFFYLMFVLLPFNLIKTKKILKRVLQILVTVGVLVSANGLLSVLFSSGPWYTRRAVPFSIGNFNPLGGNHNAIAEVLVVAIPAAMILFIICKNVRLKGWHMVSILFMMAVLLLTFSRSGWLALLLELLILFFVRYRYKFNKYALVAIIFLLIFTPLMLYFSVWQDIGWVQVSNNNRIMMSRISWHNFMESPLIGNGLNSFQGLVGSTFVYSVEFGDPLDSHGFVQKLMTESGALGLITFLILLGYFFREYIKARWLARSPLNKLVILCFIMMLAGIVFFESFSTSYFIATMWLPIGVGLAGVKLYSRR